MGKNERERRAHGRRCVGVSAREEEREFFNNFLNDFPNRFIIRFLIGFVCSFLSLTNTISKIVVDPFKKIVQNWWFSMALTALENSFFWCKEGDEKRKFLVVFFSREESVSIEISKGALWPFNVWVDVCREGRRRHTWKNALQSLFNSHFDVWSSSRRRSIKAEINRGKKAVLIMLACDSSFVVFTGAHLFVFFLSSFVRQFFWFTFFSSRRLTHVCKRVHFDFDLKIVKNFFFVPFLSSLHRQATNEREYKKR